MLHFKVRSTRSWLHHKFGKHLAGQLGQRLVDRCHGERGLFLTLTYARDDYDDPRDLYHRSRDERHVRRFMARLAKFLGQSLTGRWLCKLEFQRGGWIHWHVLILGIDRIEHAALTEIWGHGFTFISKATPGRIRYLCKYISKTGELPAFLYMEAIRSVKIIRTSSGFWNDQDKGDELGTCDDDLPTHNADGIAIDYIDEPKRQKLHNCYVSIGEIIERNEQQTVVRDDRGRYAHVNVDPWSFFEQLKRLGAQITGGHRGWIEVSGVTWDQVGAIAYDERQAREDAAAREAAGTVPPSRSDGLYLTDGGNPPPRIIPKWLERVFAEQFAWANPI